MGEPWEIVRTAGTDEEATVIAGFLRSHGIPAEVESLLFHQEPMTCGQLGDVRVRVPSVHRDTALELLEEIDRGDSALDDPEPLPPLEISLP